MYWQHTKKKREITSSVSLAHNNSYFMVNIISLVESMIEGRQTTYC